MSYRRRNRAVRAIVILLAVVVLVPVLAGVGAIVFVDPNAWRPRIEAAVSQATGRTLRLGRLSLVALWSPTVSVRDLALANLPGGSRPAMITVARAEAKLALLPLLAGRVEITSLVLLHPDILLERDGAGRPNWSFTPPPAATTPATAAGTRPGLDVLVRALTIEDGTLTWRGAGAAAPVRLDLRTLGMQASGLESPVAITAQGAYAGQGFALSAETGPLSRLRDAAAPVPWPVKGTVEIPGARLVVDGSLTHPLALSKYAFSVEGAAVSLSAFDGLLATHLLPLRQVAFAARVVQAAGRPPEVSGMALRAGASDLGSLAAGLKLDHAELSAAALGEPVRMEAMGSLGGTPLKVTASLGPLAMLLPGPTTPAPYPVELAAEAAGATLAVKGSIARPAALSGFDLAVTGRIPDLSQLSALAGTALPALRPVTLDARVTDRDGTPGFAIRGLAVTAPEADLSGELVAGLGPRPSVQATLVSRRIDLDAIMQAIPSAGQEAPSPTAPSRQPAWVNPDTRFPLAALGLADADLQLSVGQLVSGGTTFRDISGHLLLQGGRLALDPFSATLPGGRMEAKLSLDSHSAAPPAALTLHAPGVSLKPLLAALRLPGDIAGTADIDADLHGAGDTPRALAASARRSAGHRHDRCRAGQPAARIHLRRRAERDPQFAIRGRRSRPARAARRSAASRSAADADSGIVTLGTLDAGRRPVAGERRRNPQPARRGASHFGCGRCCVPACRWWSRCAWAARWRRRKSTPIRRRAPPSAGCAGPGAGRRAQRRRLRPCAGRRAQRAAAGSGRWRRAGNDCSR